MRRLIRRAEVGNDRDEPPFDADLDERGDDCRYDLDCSWVLKSASFLKRTGNVTHPQTSHEGGSSCSDRV